MFQPKPSPCHRVAQDFWRPLNPPRTHVRDAPMNLKRSTFLRLTLATIAFAAFSLSSALAETPKVRKLILIAGPPSHPPMMHEFRAGTLLLEKRLKTVPGLKVERYDRWVDDEKTFADADAVVVYSDGNASHPVLQKDRLKLIEKLVARGVGFGCMHYAVEVPAKKAGKEFRAWIGGCYEHQYSCNPIWTPKFEKFPKHPITRGVKPFAAKDEWYFNMRFTEGFDADGSKEADGVKFTPILVDAPTDATRDGPYVYPKGPYAHIQAAKGRKEAMMWAVERPDGGRGFGFTGGHLHVNWKNDDYRKTVLNALCWVAKVPVPDAGIESATVSDEELSENLDPKGRRKKK